MTTLTDFQLEMMEKDAKRLVICTGCYGVGQKHYAKPEDHWELCPVCEGLGRAAADPDKLLLIAEVRRLSALGPQE